MYKRLKSKAKSFLITLFSVLLIITALPAAVHAEASITTNKTSYEPNEPIMVTAEGGKWVRVYKSTEDPTTKKEQYYYSIEVDEEAQNIYKGIKGNRGSSTFYGLPWNNTFIAVLFSDDTYDSEVARTEFTVPKPSKFYNSISVDPSEYLYGDRVFIAASSNSQKPHVGVFEGHHELSAGGFADLTEIRSFFLPYVDNQGMYIENLPVGEYTAVMFGGETQGNAVSLAYFEIKERDAFPPISTEKDEFEISEEISVLTYYSGENAWVGLFEKDAIPGDVEPLYSYTLSGELPQRMNLKEETAVRPEDFVPGEYKIILFGDDGYDNIVSSVDIRVNPEQTGAIYADKEEYKVNEPIMVTAEGGTWIGVYKSDETPSAQQDKYFYKLPASSEPQNIYAGVPGERGTSFIASIPKSFSIQIVLFGDNKYSKILDNVVVKTVSAKDESSLSAEDNFTADEEVEVFASSNERDAWVGIYGGLYNEEDDFSTMTPATMFYVAHKDNVGGSIGQLPAGYYTAVLFMEGDHVVDKTAQFTVIGEETVLLSTSSDSYKEEESIFVTTDYYMEGAWVGVYPSEEWETDRNAENPIVRYDLSPEQPQSVNIMEEEFLRPNDFLTGYYTVVLFGGSDGTKPLAEKKIHVLRPETVVLTQADCENYGYLRVTDTAGVAKHVIVPPLGHNWGEWISVEGTNTHTRICKNDPTHVDTEFCVYGKGVVEEEATPEKPGTIRYTCKQCGATHTEEVPYVEEGGFVRYSGKTRYETSISIAEGLKASLGVDKFEAVILVSGTNYPDALSGAFMAYQYHAPILVVRDKEADLIADYVKKNLAADGKVYILGGEAAVSKAVEDRFAGYDVKRISGKTRYETNLLILQNAKITDEDILICTGKAFADSLSASAVKRPILLVKTELSADQLAFLEAHKNNKFYIIGGTGAVSERVEEQVAAIHECKRISGKTRYVTSTLIAEEFFKDPAAVTLSYGQNYPDGLCGGPLAIAADTPLILTREKDRDTAKEYCDKYSIIKGIVLGGTGVITDETADYILADAGEDAAPAVYHINYYLNDGFGSLKNPVTYKTG
ncbi:MAG: cell wall-binding repeat-containing protein, partial [Erysipelotrichaceae bacterium]|nr:cell wall-binding repeat-containing protein [Erysipelotrichaceae bacterium]